MAFLGIKVPHEIARLLAQVDYGAKGKPEPTDNYHITLVYFGEGVPIEQITKAILTTYKVTSKTRPFTVQTSRVSTFPPHPDEGTVPVICRVDSTELHDLRAKLVKTYDDAGVSFDTTFPVYKPHLTLAYIDPGEEAKKAEGLDLTIPVIEWGVGEIVLWGGDNGDERIVVTFPFALPPTREAVYRAMVRATLYHRPRRGSS